DISTSRYLIDKPDRFYGRDNENPTLWLQSMDVYITITKLKDMEAVLVASTYMKEDASRWWQVAKSKIKDWESFKLEFRKYYMSTVIQDDWWNQLERIKQG
ncbi:uncharacterized protein BX664DRAFT_239150, partial [Halteromyces radiatus]|uniref:uncharacterized protein n=1 Tax=Halteromyces radiatus TaxID=101107 RepID=UPI00221E8BFC